LELAKQEKPEERRRKKVANSPSEKLGEMGDESILSMSILVRHGKPSTTVERQGRSVVILSREGERRLSISRDIMTTEILFGGVRGREG
jgi:hypothetical protein